MSKEKNLRLAMLSSSLSGPPSFSVHLLFQHFFQPTLSQFPYSQDHKLYDLPLSTKFPCFYQLKCLCQREFYQIIASFRGSEYMSQVSGQLLSPWVMSSPDSFDLRSRIMCTTVEGQGLSQWQEVLTGKLDGLCRGSLSKAQ